MKLFYSSSIGEHITHRLKLILSLLISYCKFKILVSFMDFIFIIVIYWTGCMQLFLHGLIYCLFQVLSLKIEGPSGFKDTLFGGLAKRALFWIRYNVMRNTQI